LTGKPNHSLYLRIASALVLAPLVLWAIAYGGNPFLFMMGVAIAISVKEWGGMAKLAPKPLVDIAWGIPYILICFAAFIYLRLYYREYNGTGLTLALLFCVWASDIGAYFAGKTIGGPKMAPAISPNKTWAGLIGGIVSSIGIFYAYVFSIGPYLGDAIWSDLNLPEGFTLSSVIIIGVLIAVFGQAGDLLISMQKRKVGVKDTGVLIPGHGGLLDRIDALLLCAPVYLVCLKVLGL
jgi:phosphatidate cytidylyltransferase